MFVPLAGFSEKLLELCRFTGFPPEELTNTKYFASERISDRKAAAIQAVRNELGCVRAKSARN